MSKRVLMMLAGTVALAGCGRTATGTDLAIEAMSAMGGADRVRAIETLQMTGGTGTRFRHGQTPRVGDDEPVATLTNVVETADLANGRAALDYTIEIPGFTQHRQDILAKKGGGTVGLENVEGRPLAVTSESGLFSWGTQNSPAFLLRRNIVTVLRAAADAGSQDAQDMPLDGVAHKHASVTLASGDVVGIYFDPTTKLVNAYETTDTESMLGDVPARYTLADYRDINGVRLPHKITITKGGQPYAEVQFSGGTINEPKALEVFAIPDAAQAEVDTAMAAGDFSPLELVKVADDLFFARAYSHNSMVAVFPSFLAVVEAPYTDAQSQALVRALERQFPGKPIRYAAVTHHHYDHIGGVRGLAAKGAAIVVDKGHEVALKAVVDAPHTRPQDELDRKRKAAQPVGEVEAFETKRVIAEGPQSLELHTITGNPHVDPMVIAYVPSRRVLFQSDIWFPGLGVPGGPDSAHLLQSIQKLGLSVDRHVGGHGGVGPHAELVKAVAAIPPATNQSGGR
jgi:glyoxylase-like metal-dependent hydrolase (beta-lactamase superfamily II)